ncbi:predicted protein [Nematostella vectensis]|uniref:WD repeat-containing protein 55 homolog n=1 Tax=Nematostella vectensis TaxID=45351 RepID=A7T637_NEMVE|nr:predicted protein [Nematostella vectensis]|eukprot:XP_001620670.1 hypothetical protein NEMVEDRAFT_v1g248770 [Nematostella vectensis]
MACLCSKEIFPHSEAKARLAAQIADKYDWLGPNRGIIKDLNQNTKQRPSFAINQMPSEHTSNIALLRSVFVEDLDLLVVASEDHNIYVWGFDMDAVSVLQNMRPADESLIFKYAILLGDKVPRAEQENVEGSKDQDSVTNRVAGFICRNVLTQHTNCVTGLAVVGKDAGYGTTFLISAGWDRRILLWDLETVRLHDSFRNTDSNASSESEELASDGIILDLTYSADRDEFAYASSDKLVYIRRFSDKGREMKLLAVLQGHEADVTQVRWSSVRNKWVTGSEDGTIRVWNADGMSCELVLSAQGAVSALCIDQVNGCIVAGIQEVIRVYDPETRKIVQKNVGHTDSVRCVMHIPERSQVVKDQQKITRNNQKMQTVRDEFAYASSDKLVYIRRFSDKGREMKLLAVLQGHEADVTQNADGMSCELVLSAQGAVSALCIDQVNGCIVAGIQEVIRCKMNMNSETNARYFLRLYKGILYFKMKDVT